MSESTSCYRHVQHRTQAGSYNPKTSIIRGETVAPGEFFGIKIDNVRFMPQVEPGQSLVMRRGCLAEVGDIVAFDEAEPSRVSLGLYAEGMDYCAVCVAIETDLRAGVETDYA